RLLSLVCPVGSLNRTDEDAAQQGSHKAERPWTALPAVRDGICVGLRLRLLTDEHCMLGIFDGPREGRGGHSWRRRSRWRQNDRFGGECGRQQRRKRRRER